MTRAQALRRHLLDEHPDIDDRVRHTLTHGLASFDYLASVHVEQHDRRGSVHHTSHKGIAVEKKRTTRSASYTRDSLESALIVHDVQYSPPEAGGGRRTWLITTGTGTYQWNASQVFAFCCGLAMGKLK